MRWSSTGIGPAFDDAGSSGDEPAPPSTAARRKNASACSGGGSVRGSTRRGRGGARCEARAGSRASGLRVGLPISGSSRSSTVSGSPRSAPTGETGDGLVPNARPALRAAGHDQMVRAEESQSKAPSAASFSCSAVGEAEQVAEHPVVVLTERRARPVVAVGASAEPEAVALVEPVAHERVGERDEVLAVRELRVVVDVAEVLRPAPPRCRAPGAASAISLAVRAARSRPPTAPRRRRSRLAALGERGERRVVEAEEPAQSRPLVVGPARDRDPPVVARARERAVRHRPCASGCPCACR